MYRHRKQEAKLDIKDYQVVVYNYGCLMVICIKQATYNWISRATRIVIYCYGCLIVTCLSNKGTPIYRGQIPSEMCLLRQTF